MNEFSSDSKHLDFPFITRHNYGYIVSNILQSYLMKFEATNIVHNSACWIHNGSIIIKA